MAKQVCKCPVCGKEFQSKPSLHQVYCSKECAYSAFPKKRVLAKNEITGEEKVYESIYKAAKETGVSKRAIAIWAGKNYKKDNISWSFL